MATIEVREEAIVAARAALMAEAEARFPLATGEERDEASDLRVVRETEFVTDPEGKIIGKREVAKVVTEQERSARPLLAFLTPDEIRSVARTVYATRTRPGAIEFDWSVVERAIGRSPSGLDMRVLKGAAVDSAGGALGDRLDRLVEALVEADPAN